MKEFAVAAALLTAIVATPALAAPAGEGRVEVRGGLITGNGADEGTAGLAAGYDRSEEHTSELQSLMRISYAVFCLKKKKRRSNATNTNHEHDDNLIRIATPKSPNIESHNINPHQTQ